MLGREYSTPDNRTKHFDNFASLLLGHNAHNLQKISCPYNESTLLDYVNSYPWRGTYQDRVEYFYNILQTLQKQKVSH
jgi:hypothetical protein